VERAGAAALVVVVADVVGVVVADVVGVVVRAGVVVASAVFVLAVAVRLVCVAAEPDADLRTARCSLSVRAERPAPC